MARKKAAILTRTTTLNFGTILQAYSLQKYIKKLGYDVWVIDDQMPRRLYCLNINSKVNEIKTVKEFVYNLYDRYTENKIIKNSLKHINKFKKKHINYFKIEKLNDLNERFDIFISGSDQIWADTAEPYLFPFFMQDFVDNSKLKLSYAVTVGIKKYDLHNETVVTKLLRDFDFLSVREFSSKKALAQYTDKDITIACDPVLLLKSSHWSELSGRKKLRRRYIFCYFLSDNDWYYDKLLEICKLFNIDVYIFQNGGISEAHFKHKKINTCSPTDFLNYICYADFVVTDSYHATLFSVIFNRRFNVFERFENSSTNIQNGRIQYILDKLDLMQYYIKPEDTIVTKEYSYDKIKINLEKFTKESTDFLQNALGGRE